MIPGGLEELIKQLGFGMCLPSSGHTVLLFLGPSRFYKQKHFWLSNWGACFVCRLMMVDISRLNLQFCIANILENRPRAESLS